MRISVFLQLLNIQTKRVIKSFFHWPSSKNDQTFLWYKLLFITDELEEGGLPFLLKENVRGSTSITTICLDTLYTWQEIFSLKRFIEVFWKNSPDISFRVGNAGLTYSCAQRFLEIRLNPKESNETRFVIFSLCTIYEIRLFTSSHLAFFKRADGWRTSRRFDFFYVPGMVLNQRWIKYNSRFSLLILF